MQSRHPSVRNRRHLPSRGRERHLFARNLRREPVQISSGTKSKKNEGKLGTPISKPISKFARRGQPQTLSHNTDNATTAATSGCHRDKRLLPRNILDTMYNAIRSTADNAVASNHQTQTKLLQHLEKTPQKLCLDNRPPPPQHRLGPSQNQILGWGGGKSTSHTKCKQSDKTNAAVRKQDTPRIKTTGMYNGEQARGHYLSSSKLG